MKTKIKIKIPIIKPRNLLVPELFKLNSGPHRKPEKSLRVKIKVETRNNIDKEFDK